MDNENGREQLRQAALQQQQASVQFGVVTHERGLEIVDTSGWILFGADMVCIFPDNTRLIVEQPRIVMPFHRVVAMSLEGQD